MPTGKARSSERGALLAGMAALVAILSIFSMIGFQEYAEILRRDNEAEMMFRAQEIVRAIQRYRLDRGGTAPLKFEDLMEPGSKGQYFLRRLYKDPLTKDGKWGLLFVGPNNEIVDPNADEQSAAGLAALQGQGGLGALNQGQRAGQFGNESQRNPDKEAVRDQQRNGGQAGGLDGLNPDGGNGNNGLGSGRPGGLGGVGNQGSGEETGLPIAGVRTLADDKPFRVYNGLTEYSEWLFTYFDLENARVPGQNNRAPGRGGNRNGTGLQNPGGRPGSPGGPGGLTNQRNNQRNNNRNP